MALDVPSVRAGALTTSYTWRSPIPDACIGGTGTNRVPCVLGVDEAGRGPVLGPLVYGIAYCAAASHDGLRSLGFADSKTLTPERRDALLGALTAPEAAIGWAVRVVAPQDISAGMLRRKPHNLNAQSCDATVMLIQGVLDSGVDVTHIFVDTVGEPKAYASLLRSHFPRHGHIQWTVTRKADAIYPIVGAASIAAKVTRDYCLERWTYAEQRLIGTWTGDKRKRDEDDAPTSDVWDTGSGYPGDARTVRYLQQTLDPVFGWAGIVRFSWATAKSMLEEKLSAKAAARVSLHGTPCPPTARAYHVRWIDEPATLTDFFGKPGARPAARGAAAKKAQARGVPADAAAAPAVPKPAVTSAVLAHDRDALLKQRHDLCKDLALAPCSASDLFP